MSSINPSDLPICDDTARCLICHVRQRPDEPRAFFIARLRNLYRAACRPPSGTSLAEWTERNGL
jgi:hypothetical protein